MVRFLYDLLIHLTLPLILLRIWYRGRREPPYRQTLWKRFGHYSGAPVDIWIHAVSLGEVRGAEPLIREVRERRPELRILLTSSTAAGLLAGRSLAADGLIPACAPIDLRWAVRRFLRRARPRLLVLMERELWPNVILESKAMGIKVALLNARLGATAARRYALLSGLVRQLLQAVDLAVCQSTTDSERFISLGMKPAVVRILRSLKLGMVPKRASPGRCAILPRGEAAWLAASTHRGEEEAVLRIHNRLRQSAGDIRLWLAPRHLRRVPDVERLLVAANMRHVRLSEGREQADAEILLIDTQGDLASLYAEADLAFIGGSLVDAGGHNVAEAAASGTPVIVGPHTGNWQETVAALAAAGGLRIAADAGQLQAMLLEWLLDPGLRRAAGQAGKSFLAGYGKTPPVLFDQLFALLDTVVVK